MTGLIPSTFQVEKALKGFYYTSLKVKADDIDHVNEVELLAQLEARKKDPKKAKKTGFAARLEAMQKQQEQLLKERQNKK